jgi:aromatic-L-amino-acid decarboxylase
VDIWAALLNLGRDGIADLVERTCGHARTFAHGLERCGFEILNDVVLNQVLVCLGSPEITRAVIDHLQASGVCWFGGTVWQGRTAMRISVSNWSTTEADVQLSIEAIARAAEQ